MRSVQVCLLHHIAKIGASFNNRCTQGRAFAAGSMRAVMFQHVVGAAWTRQLLGLRAVVIAFAKWTLLSAPCS